MISLGIGEIYFDSRPTVVSTILGSCVSVCLFSKSKKIGGITHYALPDRSHAFNSSRSDLNFGDLAIMKLHQEMLNLAGGECPDMVAKVVGGANVVSELTHATAIGNLNVEVAFNILKKLNIKVIGQDVGGKLGRKIYFYTESGRLRVAKMDSTDPELDSKIIPKKKVRVLIVDDSKTIRELLSKILNSDEIEVVGQASCAAEAEVLIDKVLPDVITLDIHMPGMDGVTFLETYLSRRLIPTVMISSININESGLVMKALELGAVDYIQKPTLNELPLQTNFIREKILTAASIKVSRRKVIEHIPKKSISYLSSNEKEKIIAIGASTGGTEAIKAVLQNLPANIPPILIVQHIPPVFSTAFSNRLNELCPFEVREARDGDEVIPGRVLIAPGDFQMELIHENGRRKVRVFEGEKVNRHRPSVDVLFNSVAKLEGNNAVGVILTGMGNDGASGLLQMKKAGACTIGQDEFSSVVYGMPKAAFQMNAISQVSSLLDIPLNIIKILEQKTMR